MSETRNSIVASWRAAQREADRDGIVRFNHASAAGWLLDRADGNAEDAMLMAEQERVRWAWWAAVVRTLARVVVEERNARADRAAE